MLVLALVTVPISCLNEVHNLAIIKLLTDVSFTSADELGSFTSLFLDMARNGVLIAQIFWGLWLVPLGLLVYEAGYLPKWIGVSLFLASTGYIFDSFAQLISTGTIIISQFTFLFEMTLPVWLVVKGVDKEKWESLDLISR